MDFEIVHQLDPVIALKVYLSQKRNWFGLAPELPAFVHDDGSLYSKVEFNKDLKLLQDNYPELALSPCNSWSGHSFRSALATLLQSLGFDDESIKSWGRWSSNSYVVYMKDQEVQIATKARLTITLKSILPFM